MKKSSILAIATLVVATLAGVQASIKDYYNTSSNCTGFYYKQINTALLDCYDTDGEITNREEQFYKSELAEVCNSTQWSTILRALNLSQYASYPIGNKVSTSQYVKACDYYEYGKGYQFTQVDKGIGLIVIKAREGQPKDLEYKSIRTGPVKNSTYWSWSQLASLIDAYSQSQGKNAPSNIPPSLPNPPSTPLVGGDVWPQLGLNWTSLNKSARGDANATSWNKTQWKYWIQAYVQYYNAYQEYTLNYNQSHALTFFNSGFAPLNFSQIWIPVYERDFLTISQVLQDINTISGVANQTLKWYNQFFGSQGYVRLNVTQTISQQRNTLSRDMEGIVNYIRTTIAQEIKLICPDCKLTLPAVTYRPVANNSSANNGTTPSGNHSSGNQTNGTNGTNNHNNGSNSNITNNSTSNSTNNGTHNGINNVTNNVTNNGTNNSTNNGTNNTTSNVTNNETNSSSSLIWNFENYSLPQNCSYNEQRTIDCQEGVSRRVFLTFEQMNDYFRNPILDYVCSTAISSYSQCQNNSVVNDIDTCFSSSYYEQFLRIYNAKLYAWLYFDLVAFNKVYDHCLTRIGGFDITSSQLRIGFQYQFGTANN